MGLNFFFFILLYTALTYAYFKVADHFNIIDKPNERSSHSSVTIRGGGIIFPIAFIISFFLGGYYNWSLFCIALVLVSLISFLDDMHTLNNKVRLAIQFSATWLMIMQTEMNQHWFVLLVVFIVITGIINAYNFMDGINGITALYSIIAIATLFWASRHISTLLPDIFFVSILAALVVFSFFNLRKKAKCFAGDVGSISIAFLVCFCVLLLIIQTRSVIWLLLLGIYGIDAVFTIIFRLVRKENIFKAHRSHFYQYLVNDAKMGHIIISFLYALAQLLLNICVIWGYRTDSYIPGLAILSVFILLYLVIRFRFEGRNRLLVSY